MVEPMENVGEGWSARLLYSVICCISGVLTIGGGSLGVNYWARQKRDALHKACENTAIGLLFVVIGGVIFLICTFPLILLLLLAVAIGIGVPAIMAQTKNPQWQQEWEQKQEQEERTRAQIREGAERVRQGMIRNGYTIVH